jgi:hypothetical protein
MPGQTEFRLFGSYRGISVDAAEQDIRRLGELDDIDRHAD